MSRESTEEDRAPEDAPDWFGAEVPEGSDASATDEGDSDWLAGVEGGDWFDDPDHRPIATGTDRSGERTGEPADTPPGDATEETETVADEAVDSVEPDEAVGTGEETGAAESVEPAEVAEPVEAVEAVEPAEVAEPAEVTDDPDTRMETTSSERTDPESVGPAGEPGAGEDSGGPRDDGSEGATIPPSSPASGEDPADTEGRDGTDDTGSLVHRLIAWLRSLIGRSS